MKILIAPDKFKGCLTAMEVSQAIAAGLRRGLADVEVDLCPMADGGEGTVEALVAATGGRIETRRVCGPLPGMRVEAPIGILGNGRTAVIEMASASGMQLLPPEKLNPMRTTTYGTGELMRHAVDLGAEQVIIGIGGSATVDGGIGAVQGWGGRVTLGNEQTYSAGDRVLCGADLERVARVEVEDRILADASLAGGDGRGRQGEKGRGGEQPLLSSLVTGASGDLPSGRHRFVVATDVGNPLYGEHGAAVIFGPQKGATPEQVKRLEAALVRLARRSHAPELADAPGAGAAGGLGFGLMSFFGAEVRSGIDTVIEATGLRGRLAGARLCITGEGQLDRQSLSGKTCVGVARVCRSAGVPCVALAGTVLGGLDEDAVKEGLLAWFSICDRPMTLAQAMEEAAPLLSNAAANVLRLVVAATAR